MKGKRGKLTDEDFVGVGVAADEEVLCRRDFGLVFFIFPFHH